ncbi:bifunctional diaminohydroxyphosphoribosylaminopyrimidine deaminase/5-amino-6-(5-phosphoribosylamino)uracil reductase RibD [Sphingobium sufflavum]|uniref:bifunctional diaminohydroxyphosphoribosylaminopyrimidine deaminase/5-amino-6-(5-phosphoribosylamino)uracil reductase RibD n=1 Tax=Sphingobium sufflavum TaxID=1129547 RepID=UPI001F02DA89|nr:bifunctional diaminohydroxyphosphoribosylaminopyrimidine deaminase/5-amino-6-(5-phosphoribosylamino)uracil reductase RibD [Sphingobium sufflavum]MCE7794939.1 bifunctional diaminohydroxyphosphoribosylaminopyrimidine deaminase/5-amino-6-(5-phosphoribosylamino)uracil reductase RibD [Sphingobium sufflavum]
MAVAIALSQRGAGRTERNPNVGCVIVADGQVVGRGWTQPGGRPHAEAMALAQADERARGATAYVTLEPCAHLSERGPRCADLLIAAGLARVVIATGDPDPRTNGQGAAMLRAAGIGVETGLLGDAARAAMAGYFTRAALGRPHVTLKIAVSLDGCIAMADGTSRWITGPEARAHAHVERARADAILVGRGTLEADAPRLDVRIAGLADRAPRPLLLSRSARGLPAGWLHADSPQAVAALDLPGDRLLVEGGAGAASAFLAADMVDRLLIYRAPILIGGGRPALGDIGLTDLARAHGRWRLDDRRTLGVDSVEVYVAEGRG